MIAQGWPVLFILLLCSIISLAVAWERWRALRITNKSFTKILEDIVAKCRYTVNANEKDRITQNEILRNLAPLQERLYILATIASVSPFIGLFGTVIGIIRAFRAVAVSMGGGPSAVANGIAEALITTAAGLAVAIPAYIAYNFFAGRLERLEERLQIAAADILSGK